MYITTHEEKDRAVTIRSITNRLLIYWAEKRLLLQDSTINMAEFMHEGILEEEEELQEEVLEFAQHH